MKQNEFVPPAGAYLENCKYVDHGYFGNSEVRKLDANGDLTRVRTYVLMKTGVNWWVS